MPEYHNNIICVTPRELESCGIKLKTTYSYISKQEKGELFCWENHKSGKNTFIHYDSLKDKYKDLVKVNLCNGLDPKQYLINRQETKARASLESLTDNITALVVSDPGDLKSLSETKLYTPIEVHQLARAAAWLRLFNEYDVKMARKLGFESINDFRSSIFKRCLNEQTSEPQLTKFKKGLITNENWFYRSALLFKRNGISSLIHKGAGNVNRERADTLSHAKLIELASDQVKYSFEDISLFYNTWAMAHNKEKLTTSTIKTYLNTPKIKKIWFYARHGKLAADNEIQPLINRAKPSFPDALWSLDGTTTQLYYYEDGKIKSDLYAYFVTDAHSGAILGHSLAFAETSELVDLALRDALTKHGYRPYQLQYDNSSANISYSIKKLMSNMSRVHFACEPYKGRSKYVEGIIGHFQQRVLRYFKNFKGGNITAKSLNSKANPELLKQIAENPKILPSREQILIDFEEAISSYNNRGEKRDNYGNFIGQTKLEIYSNTEHADRVKVNYFDRISLFMIEQKEPYQYTTNGITIEIKGTRKNFIVPDPDTVGDFIFASENLGRKFKIKLDRQNPDMIALYNANDILVDFAYEKEKYASCVADAKADPERNSKRLIFKQKQDDFGSKYSIMELERQLEILGEMKGTGTDGLGWWDTSKHINNLRESASEDKANGMDDGLTDRQRKILSIGKS